MKPYPQNNQWYLALISAVIPVLHTWNLSANSPNPFLTSFYKREKVRGSFLTRQIPWPIRTWKASKGKASPKNYPLLMKLSSSPWRGTHSLLQHEQRYATLNSHHSCWRTKPQLQSLSWCLWQGSEESEFQEQICFSSTTTTTASLEHFSKSAFKIQEQNARERGCRQWLLWHQITSDSSNTINHRGILGSAQFLTGSNLPPKVIQSWEGINICKIWMLALSSAFCLCKSEPRISAVRLGLWEAGNMIALKTVMQCSDP